MDNFSLPVIDLTIRVNAALKRFQQETKPAQWDEFLCGACAVGSVLLKEELAKIGVTAIVLMTEEQLAPGAEFTSIHCFCVVYNDKGEIELILDPTFSQFNPRLDLVVLEQGERDFDDYLFRAGDLNLTHPHSFLDWVPEQQPDVMLAKVKKYLF